ncbi:MAG TPA: hypothetical protein DCM40_22075, partial [Maribacter sp.]|nr:hypothetical protein [Maribacter sp.]
MSKLYSESNKEGARKLFDKRLSYEARVGSYGKSNVVNFDFGEKMFYGRMDIKQKAIVLNENMNLLSNLPSSKDKISNYKALKFVTEAFKMLRFEINKAV